MTKRMKSGAANRKESQSNPTEVNREHTKKDLDKHIVGKAILIEENAVGAPVSDIPWNVEKGEVHSSTHLEDDDGTGPAVVIRAFDFQANPESFRNPPTKQDLFNAHYQQIEVFLMKDGLKVMPEVNPRIRISKNKKFYRIVVGAQPMRGFILNERPQTLTEMAHG